MDGYTSPFTHRRRGSAALGLVMVMIVAVFLFSVGTIFVFTGSVITDFSFTKVTKGITEVGKLDKGTVTEASETSPVQDEQVTSSSSLPQQKPVVFKVGNTGGVGVYIRREPTLSSRMLAWPDKTIMEYLGEQTKGFPLYLNCET